jgi:hypothetical protein
MIHGTDDRVHNDHEVFKEGIDVNAKQDQIPMRTTSEKRMRIVPLGLWWNGIQTTNILLIHTVSSNLDISYFYVFYVSYVSYVDYFGYSIHYDIDINFKNL